MLVGYDLLANPVSGALHRAELAEHRMMRVAELDAVLAGLPVEDVSEKPSLGARVTRFHARRQLDAAA